MKKFLFVSLFAISASILAVGCDYAKFTPAQLDQIRSGADTTITPAGAPSAAPDETVAPEVTTKQPDGSTPSDPTTGGTKGHNPYLVCDDYETLTNCYWADPGHGTGPTPVGPVIVVANPPSAVFPVPVRPTLPVAGGLQPMQPAYPVYPGVIIDPVFGNGASVSKTELAD